MIADAVFENLHPGFPMPLCRIAEWRGFKPNKVFVHGVVNPGRFNRNVLVPMLPPEIYGRKQIVVTVKHRKHRLGNPGLHFAQAGGPERGFFTGAGKIFGFQFRLPAAGGFGIVEIFPDAFSGSLDTRHAPNLFLARIDEGNDFEPLPGFWAVCSRAAVKCEGRQFANGHHRC
jgi:hypothetical protein